ncbi:pyruvate, water dikinase [Candidatus Woesebacteria bacterium RIFOXYC1_FULL_31_51]|uniref:Phosphoenolpyruvate synthase n=1 Tax=Candidatus Woesebacteria bacterium GW2011_GWC2_31_9 TaxID=1618586 RepID=A0A0G0AZF7_9BACT|nr:MAG: phosphoenolpyruvate synthase, pyruvate, water dikinase [Candidatus Woesebacteria bacterium GW2011_GWF1_31_35]KKP23655.1 MAG: Phosphoenolpyruvate synthase [Candidatus Woesebacteria bacterium GW2011_GWC1_30_29]KKP26964.1 MAG: Phosphoenolpyruvate synthase [Candidatus Woesebacteria bacterium GW2011_GWD1_31_12]KKP27930.1 MAG: Phosphoenolpyruvate synthase [Candidatus Woesebacteria bacterium GW2011_GWB1_31_29]KKP31935.1 MAG: Phosphoenolpyruvate synthase [Candidatus Woesebacteria bacterium GW20
MPTLPLVVDFKDTDKESIPLVGGKGANIGEMVKNGFPVPAGFAVTVPAYDLFLKENDISKKIYEILEVIDEENPVQLENASKKIQKLINSSTFPADVFKDLIKSYKKLSGKFKQALVAVRSSATAEDLPGMSFAGQQASFLNIKGESNLQIAVKECWASLFTSRAIYYRITNKIKHEKVGISVLVQKMIQSDVSGVMFSIDPVSNFKDRIVIEAVWGLGEMIVQGSVIPDRYVVQKETFAILSKEVNDQKIQLIKKGQITEELKVDKKLQDKIKLSDKEIISLAKLSQKLQDHYYFPQDTEWAREKNKLYIVQTRPVTTIKPQQISNIKEKIISTENSAPILNGIPASPGIGTGIVKVLSSPKEIGKVEKGDVLVAPMTSPDYVPAMKKATAIITNEGGMTSHAAIVSREMGIPCVVGTKNATKILVDNDIVTVNGTDGNIYSGLNNFIKDKVVDKKQEKSSKNIKTATKLYVNLAEPDRALEVSKMDIDGVGLLRAEFMIADIGIHPKEAIKRKTQHLFIDKMVKKISTFTESFYPRPVIYRATDFKTNEYRSLEGGKNWEPVEPNPLLGFRGAYRYISDPEVFNLELQAITEVRKKYSNLHLMIPFVRSPDELRRVRRLVLAAGLFEDPNFKFLMMVELPVNIICLEDFIKVGIDGISIGSNDLTMLLQGTDRDNSTVATAFNEMSPEVLWALKKAIKTCNKYNITSSICGQAASTYDEMVEILVRAGITSISVNPDAIKRVRNMIHEVEKSI